jgi:hypothetical protein
VQLQRNKYRAKTHNAERGDTPLKAEASIASGAYSIVMLTVEAESRDMMFKMAPRPFDMSCE